MTENTDHESSSITDFHLLALAFVIFIYVFNVDSVDDAPTNCEVSQE